MIFAFVSFQSGVKASLLQPHKNGIVSDPEEAAQKAHKVKEKLRASMSFSGFSDASVLAIHLMSQLSTREEKLYFVELFGTTDTTQDISKIYRLMGVFLDTQLFEQGEDLSPHREKALRKVKACMREHDDPEVLGKLQDIKRSHKYAAANALVPLSRGLGMIKEEEE
jgi:hypothetical protein